MKANSEWASATSSSEPENRSEVDSASFYRAAGSLPRPLSEVRAERHVAVERVVRSVDVEPHVFGLVMVEHPGDVGRFHGLIAVQADEDVSLLNAAASRRTVRSNRRGPAALPRTSS